MTKQDRSNRQTERIRKALQQAFIALLREKTYEAISVGDIADRADVGRSTFYRHYETKADLLISLHDGAFGRLTDGLVTADDWLRDEPPALLIEFLERAGHVERLMPYLYTLGKDVDVVTRKLDEVLAAQVEARLRAAFADVESTVPLPVLAHAIAGMFRWVIQWWISTRHDEARPNAAQIARHLHHLARAMVREAFTDFTNG
ncbi:MAG: TetR/AcrR family transcriptional regulator [bacterium]|nr:TetR/AcrR family transcriptional regulator [bacterium]